MLTDTSWVKPFIHNVFFGDTSKADEYMAAKFPYINRPFYKFCYVCNESSRKADTIDYNINNFENDELYFQDPALFNDPFDCYLGFSQIDLIKSAVIDAMKQQQKYTPKMRKVINKFFSNGASQSQSLDDLSNESIRETMHSFLPLSLNSITTDPAEIEHISKLMDYLLEDENIDLFVKAIQNRATVADKQRIIDLIYSNESFTSGIVARHNSKETSDWILRATKHDMKLKVETTPDSFFDGIESEIPQVFDLFQMMVASFADTEAAQELKEVRNRLSQLKFAPAEKCREVISKICRITCLSETMDSPLMWSHYANKHFGFCLEYDFTHTIVKRYRDLNTAKIMLLPVIYSDRRPSLSRAFTDPKVMVPFLKTKVLPDSVLESIIYGLLFKSSDWSYEKEWRIIGLNMDDPVMKLPPPRKVFLGANIEDPAKERLIEISRKKHIPVYQMFLSPDKYKFEYCKIT